MIHEKKKAESKHVRNQLLIYYSLKYFPGLVRVMEDLSSHRKCFIFNKKLKKFCNIDPWYLKTNQSIFKTSCVFNKSFPTKDCELKSFLVAAFSYVICIQSKTTL